MELNADRQLSRVRIWDGSTPWLITGDHSDAILAGPKPADLVETPALPVPSLDEPTSTEIGVAMTFAGSPVPGAQFDAAVEKSGLLILHLSKGLICEVPDGSELIGALEK